MHASTQQKGEMNAMLLQAYEQKSKVNQYTDMGGKKKNYYIPCEHEIGKLACQSQHECIHMPELKLKLKSALSISSKPYSINLD